MSNKIEKKFNMDYGLLILIIILAIISIIGIYLADPIMPSYLSGTNLWSKQLQWYIIGIITMIVLYKLDIDRLFSLSKILYWVLMFLLLLLLVDKFFINIPDSLIKPVNGTTAWIQIPFVGSLQPSEFMKIILILRCANIISDHNSIKEEMSFKSDLILYWKILKIAILPLLLIIAEPDSGIPIIIIISILVMLLIGGVRKEWFIIGIITLAGLLGIIMFLFYNNPSLLGNLLGDSYRVNRFYGWLETEKYYRSFGNQLYTSLLIMGSSGFNGMEFNQVIINFPEPQTDFIFTVLGQNFGFLGSLVIIIVITIFDIKLIIIALNYTKQREKLLLAGMIGMLLFQQFQNISMIIGILPITGVTLPFISYGGSSMLSYFIPMSAVFFMSSENKNQH
jgi:rod shape determining protein RodA